MAVLRLNNDGKTDSTYGANGWAVAAFDKEQGGTAYALVQQPDGKAIVAGQVFDADFSEDYTVYGLAGFTQDGRIDSAFGANGSQITTFTNADALFDAALQQDNKIVVGGISQDLNFESSFALARYNGEGTKQSLVVKLKRFLHNHGITWNGNNNNVAYYSVERNSRRGFREVSRVRSNAVQQSYNYVIPFSTVSNNATTATDYYRVRAVSNTGQSNFSNVVAVSNEADGAINIYPNPAINGLTVKGLSAFDNYKITVTDLGGTVYLSTAIKGQATATLNVNRLRRGNYIINISNEAVNATLKFVKE